MTVLEQVERNHQNAVDQIDASLRAYERALFDPNLTIEEALRYENAALSELLSETAVTAWSDDYPYTTYGQLVLRSPRT